LVIFAAALADPTPATTPYGAPHHLNPDATRKKIPVSILRHSDTGTRAQSFVTIERHELGDRVREIGLILQRRHVSQVRPMSRTPRPTSWD